MSANLTTGRRRHYQRAFICALILSSLSGAGLASARWRGGSYEHSASDTTCSNKTKRRDPIGVLFHGTGAKFSRVGTNSGDINRHTGWTTHWETGRARYFDGGTCQLEVGQLSSKSGVGNSRYHIRLWTKYVQDTQRWGTVGTPHYEVWIDGCGGKQPGTHAIEPGAVDQGSGYKKYYGTSGFDQGRVRLEQVYQKAPRAHKLDYVYWGNTRSFDQCNHLAAGSNGWVAVISVGRP